MSAVLFKEPVPLLSDLKPVSRSQPFSRAELDVFEKLSLNPEIRHSLAARDSADCLEILSRQSRLIDLPSGKRAVITPLAEQAFQTIREASARYGIEMFAKINHELSADQNSVVFTSMNGLADAREILQIRSAGNFSLADSDKLAALIKRSVDSQFSAIEARYTKLMDRCSQNPEHPVALRLAKFGEDLKPILRELWLSSPDSDHYETKFEELQIGENDFGPQTRDLRLREAEENHRLLDLVSPECLAPFLAGRKLEDLDVQGRTLLLASVMEYPWRIVASYYGSSLTRYETEVRESSAGVTVHSHPFLNAALSATLSSAEWRESAWDSSKIRSLWERDRFSGLIEASRREAESGIADFQKLGELLGLFDGPNARPEIERHILQNLIPASQLSFFQRLLRVENIQEKITEIAVKIPESELRLRKLLDRLGLLEEQFAQAADFRQALELLDDFGNPPQSTSVFHPSDSDKSFFVNFGTVSFRDGSSEQVNFIVNAAGVSVVSYDQQAGRYFIKREGLHDDCMLKVERRCGNLFSADLEIIGSLHRVIKKGTFDHISELGENAQTLLLEHKKDGQRYLAVPQHSEQGRVVLRRIEKLSQLADVNFDLQPVTSHDENFQVFRLKGLGGLQSDLLERTAELSADPEEVHAMRCLWYNLEVIQHAEPDTYEAALLVAERYSLVSNLLRHYPDNPAICAGIVDRIDNLQVSDLTKNNIYSSMNFTFERRNRSLPAQTELEPILTKEIARSIAVGISQEERLRKREWWKQI